MPKPGNARDYITSKQNYCPKGLSPPLNDALENRFLTPEVVWESVCELTWNLKDLYP